MNKTEAHVQEEAATLAQLLIDSPRARATLTQSIERQRQRSEAQRRVIHADCPYCGSEGIVYLTLPTGVFRRRRADCCQPALRDAALAALHAGLNPTSNEESAAEERGRYVVLRFAITDPTLLRELDTHELLLETVEKRVFPTRYGDAPAKN